MPRRMRDRFGRFVRGASRKARFAGFQVRRHASNARSKYQHRRGLGRLRRIGKSKSGRTFNGYLVVPELGKWWRRGRTIDVLTGGLQRAFHVWGATKEALLQARNDYLGIGSDGSFDLQQALPNAAGMGTGLARDWVRSKLGVYRGMSRGKILSMLIGASPELVATVRNGVPHTQDELRQWNADRILADRAYDVGDGQWKPATAEQFKQSITLDVVLKGAQIIAEKMGVNDLLPPGVNL